MSLTLFGSENVPVLKEIFLSSVPEDIFVKNIKICIGNEITAKDPPQPDVINCSTDIRP